MRIGIIGLGFVGGAIKNAIDLHGGYDLSVYDVIEAKCKEEDLIHTSDIIFICVPTPTIDGKQNLSTLSSTIQNLYNCDYPGVIVVKSTVLPGTMDDLAGHYPKLRFVHNPEFLSQKTADEDFLNQEDILLSGNIKDVGIVKMFYMGLLKNSEMNYYFINSRYEATEWAKYIHNCALPIMLSFLNEVYSLIDDKWIYDDAVRMAYTQGNITENYLVPGPDNRLGWGGACFGKDTQAIAQYAVTKNQNMDTLIGAMKTNTLLRPGWDKE